MRRFGVIFAGFIVLFTCWLFAAPSVAEWLVVVKPLARADAIMVLSGSAEYRERTKRAAELYRADVSRRILLTDDGGKAGWSNAENTNHSFIELARRELVSHGVAPEDIIMLPGIVSGTDSEASVLAAEIERSLRKSVIIVTSPYHTRRSLWTFKRLLNGRDVEIGIDHSTRNTDRIWADWEKIAGEYLKLAVYQVRY